MVVGVRLLLNIEGWRDNKWYEIGSINVVTASNLTDALRRAADNIDFEDIIRHGSDPAD